MRDSMRWAFDYAVRRYGAYAAKQRLAQPGRYYGNGGTIHRNTYVDVLVSDGHVVQVWFRCQMLPFRVTYDTDSAYAQPSASLTGVELLDVTE